LKFGKKNKAMHIEALRDYCLSLNAVTEDFPFGESTLVFRIGNKIFLLTNVDEPWEFNAKCAPEKAIELRERYPDAIRPGYHMNKTHWNTIRLDMQLDEKLLRELIHHSYELVRQSLPKKIRDGLV
jgi:predicted DNA-binding protein (MmcQ/YjbR family)